MHKIGPIYYHNWLYSHTTWFHFSWDNGDVSCLLSAHVKDLCHFIGQVLSSAKKQCLSGMSLYSKENMRLLFSCVIQDKWILLECTCKFTVFCLNDVLILNFNTWWTQSTTVSIKMSRRINIVISSAILVQVLVLLQFTHFVR